MKSLQTNLDQIKEEISKLTIHNPMNEMRLNFLFSKRSRLNYFVRLIEAEKILREAFTTQEISELKLNLESTQQAIDNHHLMSFRRKETTSAPTEFNSLYSSYQELRQEVKEYKKSMNAFIRKNKRSNIGRLRLKYFF